MRISKILFINIFSLSSCTNIDRTAVIRGFVCRHGLFNFKVPHVLFLSIRNVQRLLIQETHFCMMVPNKLCPSPVQEGCRGGETQGCYIPSEEASLSSSCMMSSSMKLQRTMSSRYSPAVPLSALLCYCISNKPSFLPSHSLPWIPSPCMLKGLWKQSSVGWEKHLCMLDPLIFRLKPSSWLKFIFSVCFVAYNTSSCNFSNEAWWVKWLSVVDRCRGKCFLIWRHFCLPVYALVPNSEHVLLQLWFVLCAGRGGFYPFGTCFLIPYLLAFLVGALWCWLAAW